MTNENIKDYIGQLLNELEVGESVTEIENVIRIFKAYLLGVQHKDIDFGTFLDKTNIEKDIPAQFHTLVAQLAIFKGFQKVSPIVREYISKTIEKLLKEFNLYFEKTS